MPAGASCDLVQALPPTPKPRFSRKIGQGLPELVARIPPRSIPNLTNCVLVFLQLIKEKLLDLLGKEEEEGSHDENVVRPAAAL